METNNDTHDASDTESLGHNHTGTQHTQKADDSTSSKDSTHTTYSQGKEKEEVFVPILRTFENDSKYVAKTKGAVSYTHLTLPTILLV